MYRTFRKKLSLWIYYILFAVQRDYELISGTSILGEVRNVEISMEVPLELIWIKIKTFP